MSNYSNLVKKSRELQPFCVTLKNKHYDFSSLNEFRLQHLNNLIATWNFLAACLKNLKAKDNDSALKSTI